MFASRLGKCTFWSGALLFALWIAENLGAERFGVTALLLYLPQHGWGLLPLWLLLWALRRRQFRLAALNAAFLLFWTQSLLGFQFRAPFPRSENPKTLRLMTYNIERGLGGIGAVEDAIRAQNPDIVCLQESQGRYKNRDFAAGENLAARFPGWNSAQAGDVMTLSRWPLLSQQDYPLRGTRRLLETVYQTPKGSLRVLNVHVATSFAGERYPTHNPLDRAWQIVREAQPKAQTRMEQIRPIQAASTLGSSMVPTLMAGDFNSPPRGLFYGAISRGCDDAWQNGGRGTGHTFPSNFPVLPIDHVLTQNVSIRRAFVPDVRASDHRPLLVDFSF